MKIQAVLPFYVSKNSWFHQLHLIIKLIICLFYVILIYNIHQPIQLSLILLFLIVITIGLGLPVFGKITAIILIGCLVGFGLTGGDNFWLEIILGVSQLYGLSLLVFLISMTTRLNEILNMLSSSSRVLGVFQPGVYILSTIFAILPSIQFDLGRIADAETLRRGQPLRLYHFGSWFRVIGGLIVKTLNRAERFTDTVLDRGYWPGQVYTPLSERAVTWKDVGIALLAVLPGGIGIWLW